VTDEQREAWERVFRGPDGQKILDSLDGVLRETIVGDSSALQAHNGKRIFARELINLAAGLQATPSPTRVPGRRVPLEKT